MGLFDSSGVKADVQMSLAPRTYVQLGGTIFIASIAVWGAIYALKKFAGAKTATAETGGQVQIAAPPIAPAPVVPVIAA